MSSPWSPRREGSPDASRLLIERAHEEFVRGNQGDARVLDVRGMVRDSWRRSLDSLVGVEALPPLALTAEELERHRREHPLADVMDMIRGLLIPGEVEDAGVVVAVGDAAGRLLWVEGDAHVRALTGDMGFVAGTSWSEDAVGTSAPGTALRLDRSVQIRGAEHFNRLVQPWSCTAAPVHDPETRRLIGVIDVTGGDEVVTPQAQLLVDATARAVEGELLLARLRARATSRPTPARHRPPRPQQTRATLRVLGRDRALLEVVAEGTETVSVLGQRHAELLLMLATHRQGLSAERLGELVYGDAEAGPSRPESPRGPSAGHAGGASHAGGAGHAGHAGGVGTVTLRAEMVRLRKMLERTAPDLVPESRPYRLDADLETDTHQLLSLLDRGAHRVALAAYRGDVLPESTAPGVEELRETVRTALREALLAEASVEVLLAYADTEAGADDVEVLRLCLAMLPARSPKRAGIVARVERLEAPSA